MDRLPELSPRCLRMLMVLSLFAGLREARADDAAAPPSRGQIEADWLRQDVVRGSAEATPAEDAAGGCDGVKNGKWGFHTALEDAPWWQVDLGAAMAVDRVVIYNRCDSVAGRAAPLAVLVSQDDQNFLRVYQHDGTKFLGQTDGKPLVVKLGGAVARYVRLQVPGSNCLHLDEVEIYGQGDGRNVALGRPATQSSVCEWSTRKGPATVGYPVGRVIEQGLRLAADLWRLGARVDEDVKTLEQLRTAARVLPPDATEQTRRELYLQARWTVRRMALANPLLGLRRPGAGARRPGHVVAHVGPVPRLVVAAGRRAVRPARFQDRPSRSCSA